MLAWLLALLALIGCSFAHMFVVFSWMFAGVALALGIHLVTWRSSHRVSDITFRIFWGTICLTLLATALIFTGIDPGSSMADTLVNLALYVGFFLCAFIGMVSCFLLLRLGKTLFAHQPVPPPRDQRVLS